MFTVTQVSHPFLWWVSVELKADTDMVLSKKRLRFNWLSAPAVDTRALEAKAGETFTIVAPRTDGYCIGELVPLDRVAKKWPISRKWRTIATL